MTNSSWAKTERGTCEMFSEPEDWSSVGGTKGTGGGGIRPGASDGRPRGRGLVPRTMSRRQREEALQVAGLGVRRLGGGVAGIQIRDELRATTG